MWIIVSVTFFILICDSIVDGLCISINHLPCAKVRYCIEKSKIHKKIHKTYETKNVALRIFHYM